MKIIEIIKKAGLAIRMLMPWVRAFASLTPTKVDNVAVEIIDQVAGLVELAKSAGLDPVQEQGLVDKISEIKATAGKIRGLAGK